MDSVLQNWVQPPASSLGKQTFPLFDSGRCVLTVTSSSLVLRQFDSVVRLPKFELGPPGVDHIVSPGSKLAA